MLNAPIDLRLTDPAVDFWVDLRLRRLSGSWLAAADLASTPEVTASSRLDVALVLALCPLGHDLARRMATSALAILSAEPGFEVG
jgi:hypothetical protein